MPLSIHRVYALVSRRWRRRRFALFVRVLRPSRHDVLLDVGGYPAFWTAQPPVVGRVDTLNLHEVAHDAAAFPAHDIRPRVGDGCRLASPDGSYDIAFSNSVIEHVGPWERQVLFASELRRVGRRVWCQTPARECPLEPHYLAPFVHWLPPRVQRRLLRWFTPWGLIARPSPQEVAEAVETTRLLSRREMARLFPDCEILVEYLLPFVPKSYVAVRREPRVTASTPP